MEEKKIPEKYSPRLQKDIESYQKWPDYKAFWDIVLEKGDEEIMREFRGLLGKTPAGKEK